MTGKLRWRLAAMALLACAAGLAAWRGPLRAQPPGGGRSRAGRGGDEGQRSGVTSALAVLQAAPGGPKVEGSILFFSRGNGAAQVVADVSGVDKPGLYALHVHEKGECASDPAGKQPFASAGGDFNPAGVAHGCAEAPKHHAGDLGNIEVAADGTGHLELTAAGLTLSGANSVIDKAVVLHARTDDCVTQPDGDAGARLACGVAKSVDDTQGRAPRRRGRTSPPAAGSPPG